MTVRPFAPKAATPVAVLALVSTSPATAVAVPVVVMEARVQWAKIRFTVEQLPAKAA